MLVASDSFRPEIRARKRRRCGIDVGAHRVDAVLDDRVELPGELQLADIVLILADADRAGLDADQLGERILQPPRDRYGAAQRHVEVGKLSGTELRRRVDRRASLRHDRSYERQFRMPGKEIAHELVGFSRGGAVADRDELHVVCGTQRRERSKRAVPVVSRLMRIDGGRIEQFSGPVDNRHLDARADAGVQTHRDALACGRGEQQIVEVPTEDANRFRFGSFAKPLLDVELDMHHQLEFPGPAHGLDEPGVGRPSLVLDADARGDALQGVVGADGAVGVRQCHGQAEDAFRPAAKEREHAMRRDVLERLGGVEVVGELDAFLFFAGHDGRSPFAAIPDHLAQATNELRVLGERLHQNGARTLERRGDIRHASVGVHIGAGLRWWHAHRVVQKRERQRFESCFTGDLGFRAALRFVRQIEVFEPGFGVGVLNRRCEPGRQLTLLLDTPQDGRTPRLELAQIRQPIFQRPEGGVIQPPRGFLAITGDEGDRGFSVEQGDGGINLRHADVQFCGDPLGDGFHEKWEGALILSRPRALE